MTSVPRRSINGEFREAVTFVTPNIREASIAMGTVFALISGSMIFESVHGNNMNVSNFVTGCLVLVFTVAFVAYMFRSSSLIVGKDGVTIYNGRSRTLPYADLSAIELVYVQVGLYRRSALCFIYADRTRYVYKNFNGSPNPDSISWKSVNAARNLIEQFIANGA